MAFLDIKNVSIRGISACVPKHKEDIRDIYKWEGVEDFIESTGVVSRRHADDSTTSSDLCYHAAEKLISDLGQDKSEIDALVFVSQTHDYILPATSCILQGRLGLSKDCYTLDISLGCSGWVYAMSVISSLMQNGTIRKGLLLAGDTVVRQQSPEDKSSYPLFGEAGTATALEFDEHSAGMKYLLNSDGEKYETIIIKDGGYRNFFNQESLKLRDVEKDIQRTRLNCELDGLEVFSFGITKVPKSINNLCSHFDIDKTEVDVFSFHQANLKMNEMIRRKLKIDAERVPYCMDEFGNTSNTSIPLALVTREAQNLRERHLNHIACGFGVGLSWGSMYFETDHISVPDLIEI